MFGWLYNSRMTENKRVRTVLKFVLCPHRHHRQVALVVEADDLVGGWVKKRERSNETNKYREVDQLIK